MTPEEALEVLAYNLDQAKLIELSSNYKYWTKYKEIKEALNTLERLKKFKETFDNYELAKRQDFIAFENWLECERELTVLKRDVKQFIELLMKDNHTERDTFDIEILKDKLLEGGKEE